MRTFGFVFSAVLVCVSLSGCARTTWVKPGATKGDFEQIKAACMIEGARNIPQDNRVELVSGGHSYSSSKCKSNGTKCTSSSGYSPPRYATVDNNSGLRDQVYKACLYRNGWQEVVLKDGEPNPYTASVQAPLMREAPAPASAPPVKSKKKAVVPEAQKEQPLMPAAPSDAEEAFSLDD